MVHNMAPIIGACLECLHWTDGVLLFDDHSTDGSIEVAVSRARNHVWVERSPFPDVAFRFGELEVRNWIIEQTFTRFSPDLVLVVDADELVSEGLGIEVSRLIANPQLDSVAFTTWHLFDNERYLHFWPTQINCVDMIDPHTRVIRRTTKRFVSLCADGSHPIIEATKQTGCIHGPHHFHLKYHKRSRLPNYSLPFLPERLSEEDARPILQRLPFSLPSDIATAIAGIEWESFPLHMTTPHYGETQRVEIGEAAIHPRDRCSR